MSLHRGGIAAQKSRLFGGAVGSHPPQHDRVRKGGGWKSLPP